jgi:membrane-bound lytic murein transglycosylase B
MGRLAKPITAIAAMRVRETAGSDSMQKPFILAVALLSGLCGAARPAGAEEFSQWLAGVRRDAAAQGVHSATIDDALRAVTPIPRVIELDHKQPETTQTFAQYRSRLLDPARIAKGRVLAARNRAILHRVAGRYGVSPKTLMALWAIESNYGQAMGDFHTVDALVTLAYDGRRPDFFRAELIDALKIVDQGHFPSGALKGSWAGAMGQMQFMPSTYLHYAVDFDQSGAADIWHDTPDVFASAANYLADLGWKRDQSWGREVKLPARFDADLIGLPERRPVDEWAKLGIRRADGGALPPSAIEGSIVAPDGPNGQAFLVYDNFRAVMKWNHSTYFALAVGLLGDAIGG